MSDEQGQVEDGAGQEPSMEDILASIRRILSEDGEEEGAETPPESEAAPEPELEAEPESEPEAMIEPEPEPEPEPAPAPAPAPEAMIEPEPEPVFEPMVPPEPVPEPEPMLPPLRESVFEDVMELTADMIAPSMDVLSGLASRTSTEVLAELARAIMDRRDIAITQTEKDVTLEGMIREMLRPLLKEWLDRNLPYLIERLVKKEIDLMINRAERLED